MNPVIRNLSDQDIEQVRLLVAAGGPYVAAYNSYVYWILARYCPATNWVAEINNAVIVVITGVQSMEKIRSLSGNFALIRLTEKKISPLN